MKMNTKNTDLDGNINSAKANHDPITGEPGAHPVGTGVGAAGGAMAGGAIGALAGPVGAVIGLVAGAVAGGFAGKDIAEWTDPTLDKARKGVNPGECDVGTSARPPIN